MTRLLAVERRARHSGRRVDLVAAGRRARGRARAGHHDRRRLSLFRDRQAQVHRRRHAGPRAIYPQHGHRRLDRRPRPGAGRRAQGRADPDPAARLSRARCSASASSCWRSTRWTWSATTEAAFDAIVADYRAFARGRLDDFTAIPVSALRGRQRHRNDRRTRPGMPARRLLELARDGRARRSVDAGGAVPPAGPVGEPRRTRISAASPA